MNFCAKCGRQRTASRFCGGCGNDFGQPAAGSAARPAAADAEPAATAPAEQARWDEPTRWDPPVDVTRAEPAAAAPRPAPDPAAYNPFAPRPAEPSPAGRVGSPPGQPANRWESADTIYAQPGQTPGYPPRQQPPGAFPPPSAPAEPGRGSHRGRRAAFIIVVVLVVLGAGGGAYALVSRSSSHSAAQSSSPPAVASGASTAASAGSASVTPTASATATPSARPSASATPKPPPTGTVQIAPGVAGNSATPKVEAFLNRYFSAINTRNYSAWNSLLDAQGQQNDSQSTFESGYATTKDSNEMLTGITDTGGGDVTASVSFTSRQSPADSIDHSACNDWQLSFFLEPQGGGYVATTPPSGYQAAYTDC
jgi:hypothetical protein